MKNPNSQSGIFNPRLSIAFGLCSAGALLAVLGFAGAPAVTDVRLQGAAVTVIAPPQGAPALSVPSPVASGPIQLRPSASIAELQSLISPHAVSQTSGGVSD